MSDWVIGQIRTYVPMIAGAVAAWLVARGVLDADTAQELQFGLVSAMTALFGGLYYFVVRLVAKKWPGVGVLLGYNKQPAYFQPENLGSKT